MLSLVKVTEEAKKIWSTQVHYSGCQKCGSHRFAQKPMKRLDWEKLSKLVESYLGEVE